MSDPEYVLNSRLRIMVQVVGVERRCERWDEGCRCRVFGTKGGIISGTGKERWSSTLGDLSACGRFFRLKPS